VERSERHFTKMGHASVRDLDASLQFEIEERHIMKMGQTTVREPLAE
jgi:hypothetical protein